MTDALRGTSVPDTWFEVRMTLKLRAADERDAINRVAGAIRQEGPIQSFYPVGDFNARPCDDPVGEMQQRLDRHEGDEI